MFPGSQKFGEKTLIISIRFLTVGSFDVPVTYLCFTFFYVGVLTSCLSRSSISVLLPIFEESRNPVFISSVRDGGTGEVGEICYFGVLILEDQIFQPFRNKRTPGIQRHRKTSQIPFPKGVSTVAIDLLQKI